LYWSPPEWVYNCFPLPNEEAEVLTLDWLISTLHAHIDTVTEADTTALGQALHVGHMLVTMQGADGRWPASVNVRTGEPLSEARSFAPIPLFQRMNAMLDTTEFDNACARAAAGGYVPSAE